MVGRTSTLLTGGAGYIGSQIAWTLADAGRPVVVLDNLSSGYKESLPPDVPLVVGDIGDGALVGAVIKDHDCRAVIHLAGSIEVGESVRKPLDYYANNVCASLALIRACVEARVERFIFSSTASVYDHPDEEVLAESLAPNPSNPYGASKLMVEWMLRDIARATDLRYVALRYFNVAGGDPSGRTGPRKPEPSHLIRVACRVALGRQSNLEIFGSDYDTPDGTCVRDYIHVADLASAHVAALDYLERGGGSDILNCGYGHGVTVRQVVEAVKRVSGVDFEVVDAPRRIGDPASLVADASRLRRALNWAPSHDDLDGIVRAAYTWEKAL